MSDVTTLHTISLASEIQHDMSCFVARFVRNGSSIVHSLALGHVQLFSRCDDAPLPQHGDTVASGGDSPAPSLAAGLPHFSTGKMRCWGRDTFIALRGLMLVTGQHKHAR